ncbi:aminotransferase class I/II-fold pyridoxal phosphate-dependent enzyme [Paenibacillus sp. GCM10027626]|uniref:aminotransferase class I/II-fold pyridoxal phosphate-dependent enzyme n=1 Tax=Paenibacillus sp. GCM10027626 TaxID=3273411 RepID=UPI003633A6AC
MESGSMRWRAPIVEMLDRHISSAPTSYHVPGHKFGHTLNSVHKYIPQMAESFAKIMAIDITELTGTDDLHAPSGAIAEAQQLAAGCFGAEETYFLVGGSTAGNLAMLLACCGQGELVLVQRNVHKSVLHGLELAGAQAVFIMPDEDEGSGLLLPPSLTAIEQAMQRYPQAKAVFLSNPSYYGLSVDLRPYAELIHQYNCLLLVDEAHGAHYGLHPGFPLSAMQAGADAAVQSTHKTLSAMTMGAMLHIQGERLNRGMIRRVLTMLQSSSPSYPIMASLDIARAMIDAEGAFLFASGIEAAAAFQNWLDHSSHIFESVRCLHPLCRQDPLRVILHDRTMTMSGYDLMQRLEQHGCWAEMADSRYVVLLFPITAALTDVEKLKEALKAIELQIQQNRLQQAENVLHAVKAPASYEAISQPVHFRLHELSNQQTEKVLLEKAVNRIAAEPIVPYPPGIPVVYGGEKITKAMVDYLSRMGRLGARFQGAYRPDKGTIAVLRGR